jgi:transposase-like protein
VVVITQTCPHCKSARCKRFGTNRSGSARCRCNACNKTFTPHPHSRAMTDHKEAQIVAALQERISQRGIARTLKVARLTIRNIRKKAPLV